MKESLCTSNCGSFPETQQLPDALTSTSSSSCCYDPTLIPDTQIFYAPKHPHTAPPSTVDTIPGEGGVYSHDPILDHDAEELWRFFTSNLTPPNLAIRLLGSHTETRTRIVINRDETTRTEEYSETVTDFDLHLDVSHLVRPQWTRVVASHGSTVRAALEEYTSSRNAFKEFRVEKVVVWEYARVAGLLKELGVACSRRGVRVRAEFPKREWRVSAFASGGWSRAAHSTFVRVVCVLTCLWIVFLPVWAVARKRMKKRVVCEFAMAVGADEFYARNWRQVQEAVWRGCDSGEWLVAL